MSQAFYQTIPESNNVAIDPQPVRYINPNPVQYVLTPAPLKTPVNPVYLNNQAQKVVYVREESPEPEVVYVKRNPKSRVTIITPDPRETRVYTVLDDYDDEEEEEEEEEEEDDEEEVIYVKRTPSRKVYQVKESYEDVPARVDTFKPGYKPSGGDVEIFDEKRIPKKKSKVDSFNKHYVRPGGDVEIFDEPINHRIKSRVDSYNYGYAPKGGDIEIFDDKSRPYGKPKVDTFNRNYNRPNGEIEIFDEKLNFKSGPRVDTRNRNYSRNGGNVEVFSERKNFNTGPKIDTFNRNYSRQGGNVKVFSEKIDVNASPRVDDRNTNYKKLGGNVQVFSEKVEVRNIAPVVDTKNPNYQKPTSNLKIFSKKTNIHKEPIVDAKNSDYKKPVPNVKIFDEKVEFNKGPLIDAKNPEYKKPESDVKIFNEKVEFNKGPLIDAKNPEYKKPESDVKPDSTTETIELNQVEQIEPINEQSEKINELDQQEADIVHELDNQDNAYFKQEPVRKPKKSNSFENVHSKETSTLKHNHEYEKIEKKILPKKKMTNNIKRSIKVAKSPELSSKLNEKKMAPKKKPVVEQTLKVLENLGFKDPNVKNVKSKVSTWNSIENMNPTKPHMSYLNQYRTRDLQMSPDSKVKNWLTTSVPQSPTDNFPIESQKNQKKKENKLPNIPKNKPKDSRKAEEIQKSKKSTINNVSPRGDLWIQDGSNYNPNRSYDKNSKLPQISNKQMYDLVNTLTNRKPVRIAETDDIFDKFKTLNEQKEVGPIKSEVILADEKEEILNQQEINE